MKIEDIGVKITAGSGSIYHEIVITPEGGIYVNGASWSRAEAVDVAHALSTAVEKHDAMTWTQEQPAPSASDAPAFRVGQVLDGTEYLPVGTVVRDSDRAGSDTWTNEGDQWVTADGDYVTAQEWPRTIKRLGPVTIETLP